MDERGHRNANDPSKLLKGALNMSKSMSEYLFWTGFTGWTGL